MTDYYVSTTGSNTSPYDTWAKAANQPHTAIDYIQTNGGAGSTVYIADGAYSSYMYFDHANHVNTTLIGATRTGVIITAQAGQAVLYVATGITGVNVSKFTGITNGSDGLAVNAADTILTDIDVLNSTTDDKLIGVNHATANPTFNNVRLFKYGSTVSYPVYVSAGGATFNKCISAALGSVGTSRYWYLAGAGTQTLNNCVILDTRDYGVRSAAGTVNINNSILQGSIIGTSGYAFYRTGGTATLNNNILIASIFSGNTWTSGDFTDNNNIKTNADLRFRTYARKGYILPCVDDATNFSYAQSVETVLSSYGFKGTFFIEQYGWNTSNNAALRTMVSAGTMEAAIHSYSHMSLTFSGKIFDVTKAAETITIDRTAGTITLSGGGSVTDFKTKTLGQIKTGLEALGATVTPIANYGTTVFSYTLGEVIADGVATNQIDALSDVTAASGIELSEMANPTTWLADTIINGAGNVTDGQTGVTYVVNSFACPFNNLDDDTRTAAINIGVNLLRGNHSSDSGNINKDKAFTPSLDMYGLFTMSATTYLKGDGSETQVRNNAKALAFTAAHAGLCISILSHNATEFTTTQWGWALDEWNKYGSDIHVTSHQLFQKAISAVGSGWTDDADGTFSRTYAVDDGDYHLEPGSPALRAGTSVSFATDFEGNIVPFAGATNIGPYNNQYVGGGLSPGLGLSGGHRPPWWRRRR